MNPIRPVRLTTSGCVGKPVLNFHKVARRGGREPDTGVIHLASPLKRIEADRNHRYAVKNDRVELNYGRG